MQRLLPTLACGILAAVLVADARQESVQVPFRASVDVVDVDVSVLDENRLPVRGLTVDDFTVFEDGQERPITVFSEVDLPPAEIPPAPWMADVAPDVQSNDLSREGRLIAILVDRLQRPEHQIAVKQYAEAAVQQLRPGDLAAVAYSTWGVPQNFTSDRERLLAAIRQPLVGLPEGGDASETECACGVCTLDSISRIAEAMYDVRQRRKMLFVIGSRIRIHSLGRCSGPREVARKRAMRALEASNVTVYQLDPTGLETLASTASFSAARSRNRFQQNLQRLGDLRVLPDHTGGRFVSDPVRPADRLAEIYRESENYYVLGFQPRNAESGAEFRDIRVRVNREDVTLQARRGYYAVDEDARASTAVLPTSLPEGLRTAIDGLWPKTDIDLSMSAAPMAAPDLTGGIVALTLGIQEQVQPGLRTLLNPTDGAAANVLVGAFDRNGRALALRRTTIGSGLRIPASGTLEYQMLTRLELRPGRYEIRAAVEHPLLGRTGSVYGYVDVPDFQQEPVTLSGVFLEARPDVITVQTEELRGLLPVVPTVRRQFSRTDEVTGFFRVYQGISRRATPGYLVVQVLDSTDQVVFRQESRLVNEQFGASRALDFSFDVPVGRLDPGPYVLKIDTRHGNETASRDVRFSVE